jgi:hypothetical protein
MIKFMLTNYLSTFSWLSDQLSFQLLVLGQEHHIQGIHICQFILENLGFGESLKGNLYILVLRLRMFDDILEKEGSRN